ncbi:YlbF family regulator [Enterococcus sp. BWT-B8]|uniref:YlbF family regulator n=1 Tax=Enterococcus sp. BWT-B8 TaxID=2885157 RepID=UPI001E2D81A7|nr:YlbF family regulator [Enterococcus sp. BWT-B8]MCB5950776.1 YlbF family regulator [Enterococcus sp. BWT-B8]
MIVNESLFNIEDQTELLVQTVLSSSKLKQYKENKRKMSQSETVQERLSEFLSSKTAFERIESYGSHAPDFKTKQRALRQAKRQLDMCEEVSEFRISETDIQDILDTISSAIAKTISDDIKVDAGNPFFTKGTQHGCGGSCHAS